MSCNFIVSCSLLYVNCVNMYVSYVHYHHQNHGNLGGWKFVVFYHTKVTAHVSRGGP